MQQDCNSGVCDEETDASALLALRAAVLGPDPLSTTCWNRNGTKFLCAGGDRCCGDVCVARGDVCCENVNGHFFPCQGGGGQCCGNTCAAPGSKCCKSSLVEKSRWYPVSKDTECSFTGGSTTCWNRNGTKFLCAGGDRCCGDVCVARG